MAQQTSASADAWALIEDEKRRDRTLRRISKVAWTATFVIVLVIAVLIGIQMSYAWKTFAGGMMAIVAVVGAALPLVIVLGILSVLIATLSTEGIFLRLRTASLGEIQLRLAAIEDMLAARPDSRDH
jgi:hypothetical protein